MNVAERMSSKFTGLGKSKNFKHYLLNLQDSVEKIAGQVNHDSLRAYPQKNKNTGIYQARDDGMIPYDQAAGKSSNLNLFDYLTLMLSYVISRSPLTGTSAAWLQECGFPQALINAASAITIAPNEKNPTTLLSGILENPFSINAALQLFETKTKLSFIDEVTPEAVHSAKQYVELIGSILSSNSYKGMRANWGPLKLEKLTSLMHPDACAELRHGRFFVRLMNIDAGVLAKVYMITNPVGCDHVTSIMHNISPGYGQVETITSANHSAYADAIYVGSDRMIDNYGTMDVEMVATVIRQIHIRYGRFKETA